MKVVDFLEVLPPGQTVQFYEENDSKVLYEIIGVNKHLFTDKNLLLRKVIKIYSSVSKLKVVLKKGGN